MKNGKNKMHKKHTCGAGSECGMLHSAGRLLLLLLPASLPPSESGS